MEHHFDTEIATLYGLTEAILLNNIYFWVEHNQANNTHFYDGEYWTYNSVKAFTTLFPYLTAKKIRNALEHLEKENIIKSGNYNNSPYDRTKWYTITQKGNSILPKGQMNLSKKANKFIQKGKPIPDINTNINTNTKNRIGATTVAPTLTSENTQSNSYSSDNTVDVLMTLPHSPQTPPSPNLLDKVEKKPKKRKTKQEKIAEWISNNVNNIEIYGFSDSVKEKLEKYFNYLTNFGTLIPWESLELQMNELATISRNKQSEVIDTTIARGWKSLVYVIEQNKKSEQNLPSYRIQGGENHRSKEERQAWADKHKNTNL